jgi:DHA2 family multidrug resistance protein
VFGDQLEEDFQAGADSSGRPDSIEVEPTRREQFHSERIGESITELSLPAQQRLQQLSNHFISVGFDPVSATQKAYQAINSVVQRESFILAFNDCFEIIAIGLLIGAVLVWFCKRPPTASQGGGH